ncbi:MAG TPA: rhomboid family intramembrane serine protease [Thermoanaerobaculia bacterium]|nr:rhomboid family intramembrane serine protease [Thermoanaerobaculia bacterium]
MILLPIGRDESTIQRHAWVSYGIIAANVLMFLATTMMFRLGIGETRRAFGNALAYYADHPYLTLPPALGDLLTTRYKAQLKSADITPPIRWTQDRQQIELDSLAAKAVAAYRRLPTIRYGYIPAEGGFSSLITSMFVHAGLLHLIGNMLFFFLSGPFVEDVFGRPLFAALYFTGGLAATLTYWAQHPTSMIPLVGASGAIAAVMGAYLVRFAKSKVEFIFIPFWFRPQLNYRFFLPAFVVLPLWFGQQLMEMKLSEAGSGVAFSAHVGGFIYGAAFALIIMVTGFEEKHVAPRIQKEISWQIDPRIAAAMTARDKFDFETAKREIAPVLREKPGDIDALRTAVDIARASEDAAMLDNYGTRLLGRLIDAKEDDAAIELIQDITVQIDPSLVPKFTSRAAAFAERTGDHDWAMLLYEKALKGDPLGITAVPSLVKLGSLRKARGDVSGARTALQEARAHPKCTPEWAQSIESRLNELPG